MIDKQRVERRIGEKAMLPERDSKDAVHLLNTLAILEVRDLLAQILVNLQGDK